MAPASILSSYWNTLSLDRRKTTGASRWRFCSWVYFLVWFVLPKKRKLSQVSPRYQGWSDLGGGLAERESVCVCVCVFLLWFCYCGSIMWAISLHLNTALFTGSMPVLFHLYCVLVASYALFFSVLVTDQPNSCWIRDPAFDIRAQALSEMSQLLLSL